MLVTTSQIVRGLRAELSLNNPDYRAAGRMIAAALEQLDARAEELEGEKRRRGEEEPPPALRYPEAPQNIRLREGQASTDTLAPPAAKPAKGARKR